MRRLVRMLLAAPCAAMVGCNVGTIAFDRRDPVGDASLADGGAGPLASDVFETRVLPLLDAQCVACHGPGSSAPAFLAPDPDVYTTVTTWPALVRRSDPESSRLLTKGEHAGPAWNGTQAATVRAWLVLEAEQSPADDAMEHRTDALAPAEGLNVLDLSSMGMTGSAITFIAERTAAGLYFSNLQVSAGPTGVRLVHPVVVVWTRGEAVADSVDRFAGLEVSVPPSTSAPIGTGSLSLVDFAADDLVSFHFDEAGPLSGTAPDGGVGDGAVPSGGCTNVATFTEVARPMLTAYCTRCHGGTDPMAAAAVNMTSMETLTPTAQQSACDEILTRVNRVDLDSSAIFRAPDPAVASAHPFSFASSGELASFRTSMLLWLAAE